MAKALTYYNDQRIFNLFGEFAVSHFGYGVPEI